MAKAKKRVTIGDIAKAAEVSVATVSNVLNNKETVSPSIRENVLSVVAQLKYRPVRRRSPKSSTPARMVGLVSPDVTDPVMSSIFKGIENVARMHGYVSVLCDSLNSIELENEIIENLVQRGIDGLIIQPAGNELRAAALLRGRSYPFVIVDRKISDANVDSVISDNLEGACQAVKYLISIGHRDIVFLAGPAGISTANDRVAGYRNALADEGLPVREELIVQAGFDWAQAFRKMDEMLHRQIRFTAVFAANDLMAFGARAAIEKNGLRVPDDISIVGYNDIVYASAISLTTIALAPGEMGRNAMLLLLDIIHKRRTRPHQLVMQPRLVIRDSCRAPTS